MEKVWGRDELPAPFVAPAGQRIGEIWFEPPPELDSLLVKFLFTSERLSVQVHPSDAQAREGEEGKEECWLILDADPGAEIAIGLRNAASEEQLRDAAIDGSIEHLLEWHEVQPGDFFYLPAGTIHAIGGGLSLVEIQQNSDTTFRLYDYGRPRELHLDRAIDVAQRAPYPSAMRQRISDSSQCLVDGPHFRLDRIIGAPDAAIRAAYDDALLALPIEGELRIGSSTLAAGACAYAPSIDEVDFAAAAITLLARPA
ncbi:class I mannose-6-phosphate isomerase [Altererythrobacter sp. Z27]|uniref:class I mannose-6-phosphate isomerase n=1 Tax=Altererythrobacter sp. Z27 TaxID=3461147 RepID=UPI004043EF20